MPSRPGVVPLIAQAHAGIVIGGVMLSSSPHMERAIRLEMFGSSSCKRSNRSCGVPQSSPITATRASFATRFLLGSSTRVGRGRPRPPRAPVSYQVVRLLRRSLYAYALVSAVAGAALEAFPRSALVGLFGQVHYPEYAWVRVVGVQALGTAMLAVLVAQRVRDQWWWTWAFVIPVMLLFLVFGVN